MGLRLMADASEQFEQVTAEIVTDLLAEPTYTALPQSRSTA